MQKSVIFAKEKFEKCLKDKKYCKVRDHSHFTGEYRGIAQSICNLKYSVPKKIPIVFHNGSNCDYHFIIKELSEEFRKQFTCLGGNTEKYITFTVPIEKELIKKEKKLKKIYVTYYNLLTSQDLWRDHHQILSIISLKEYIELNVNSDTMIKNVEHVELNISIMTVFLNTQILMII